MGDEYRSKKKERINILHNNSSIMEDIRYSKDQFFHDILPRIKNLKQERDRRKVSVRKGKMCAQIPFSHLFPIV